jgi:hypothetical protein
MTFRWDAIGVITLSTQQSAFLAVDLQWLNAEG